MDACGCLWLSLGPLESVIDERAAIVWVIVRGWHLWAGRWQVVPQRSHIPATRGFYVPIGHPALATACRGARTTTRTGPQPARERRRQGRAVSYDDYLVQLRFAREWPCAS